MTQASLNRGSGSGLHMFLMFLFCCFSMSLGWRIRGQYGHETGAAIAGALGAMAIVLCDGRREWLSRIACFAVLGGLGWGFGGSISYMKVVGFTESSQSATVLYGFAGLFLIGFLWSAPGAAATAIAATWTPAQLQSLLRVIFLVCAGWFVQDVALDTLSEERVKSLNWYDTDWIAASVALGVALFELLRRGAQDIGARLVAYLAAGWWAAFLSIVVVAELRLNPPRGDNWSGCVGVVAGLLVFCHRNQFPAVIRATMVTGIVGAALFCVGQMAKLGLISTGGKFGWHATMEFIHGGVLGIALTLGMSEIIRRRGTRTDGEPGTVWPSWCGTMSIWFLLWLIPYLNLRKSPQRWARDIPAFPESFFGLHAVSNFLPSRTAVGWMEILFLVWALILIPLLVMRRRRPLQLIPENFLGRGQLLYLAFTWLFTWISFTSEIADMAPVHFLVQWGITLNAFICTGLLFVVSGRHDVPTSVSGESVSGESLQISKGSAVGSVANAADRPVRPIKQLVVAGLLALVMTSAGGWIWKRWLFGDQYTGYFPTNHIRFGSDNTNDKK
jgi:hypothetical protein